VPTSLVKCSPILKTLRDKHICNHKREENSIVCDNISMRFFAPNYLVLYNVNKVLTTCLLQDTLSVSSLESNLVGI
jgi:hypothetical protein